MGLIELLADPTKFKYESKTRKFGNDMKGGGDSGLPYVKFPMPGYGATNDQLKYYDNIATSLDYPVRGGAINFTPGGGTLLPAAEVDRSRILKFFQDKPRGEAFLQKQAGLQLSNPKIQTGQSVVTATSLTELFSNVGSFGGLENTRIYNNGRNTLAQVAAAGTGTHITRAGLFPIDAYSKYYMDVVGQEVNATIEESIKINRLMILRDLKLRSNNEATQKNITTINRLGISLSNNQLFQYLGGPGSVYGIGSTVINRSTYTNSWEQLKKTKPELFPNVFTMTYDQIMSRTGSIATTKYIASGDRNTTDLSDFRDVTGAPSGSKLWTKANGVDAKFYVKGVDKLNSQGLLLVTDKDPFKTNSTDSKDIINFGFECMSNDEFGFSTPLLFRAFLTAGISDSNSAKLNGFQYMGRGETFYTYGGFDRSISFAFKIAAFSIEEMKPLYNKLNYLISQVYPDYGKNGIMRAPLVKVTIGDYIYRVPGFLESVNVTVDNAAPWELNLDGDIAQLPKVLDVAVSFKPIHDKLPRRSTINDRMALIANNKDIIGLTRSRLDLTPIRIQNRLTPTPDINSLNLTRRGNTP